MIFMKQLSTILFSFILIPVFAQQKTTDTSSFNKPQKLEDVVVQSKKPLVEQLLEIGRASCRERVLMPV